MRYVFLALMCVFAGIHAARGSKQQGLPRPVDFWDAAGRLFFRIAASLMFVLVAVASRTGVKHQAYYILILLGLCISLASDILMGFAEIRSRDNIVAVPQENKSAGGVRGRHLGIAGLSFLAAACAAYIGAFYSYAAFSWYDAAFFVLLSALACAVIYNKKRDIFRSAFRLLFILVLCAATAKALSTLLAHNKRYLYAVFAAAGAALLACSNAMRVSPDGRNGRKYAITNTIIYYIGQALIALSVMI